MADETAAFTRFVWVIKGGHYVTAEIPDNRKGRGLLLLIE